jgi:hypothetical protein
MNNLNPALAWRDVLGSRGCARAHRHNLTQNTNVRGQWVVNEHLGQFARAVAFLVAAAAL